MHETAQIPIAAVKEIIHADVVKAIVTPMKTVMGMISYATIDLLHNQEQFQAVSVLSTKMTMEMITAFTKMTPRMHLELGTG